MPALSVHEEILDYFDTTLKALSLDGLQNNVNRRFSLTEGWLTNLKFPCVVYSPIGIETDEGVLCGTNSWGEPVTVRILTRDIESSEANLPNYLKWRKTIRDAFHEKPGSNAHWTNILFQPSPMIEPSMLAYQLVSMPISFLVYTREPR